MDLSKYGQKYDDPQAVDKFVDVKQGTVVEKENIPKIEVIRAIAKKYGIEIDNPRPGCHHCHGLGYIGLDYKTKAPVPCSCLYRSRDVKQKHQDFIAQQGAVWNRQKKRMMAKTMKKQRYVQVAKKELIKTEEKT